MKNKIKSKLLINATALFVLTSCKTTECWVETRSEAIIYHDTLTIHPIHYHYKDLIGISHCAWIDECKIPYTDTIQAIYYSWQKTKPSKCSQPKKLR